MSILITGGILHRAAGKFTPWNFRTQCSKRYTTSMQSGYFGNSTAQQNYKRGLNETAFLADTTVCCLMEIDSCCSRSNVAQRRMCADGQQARCAIRTAENQGRREWWWRGDSRYEHRGASGSALWRRA